MDGAGDGRPQPSASSTSLPTVRLPLLAESGTGLPGQTSSQAEVEPANDDLDEEDLFGSEDEGEPPTAGSAAAGPAVGRSPGRSPAGVGQPVPAAAEADELDEQDLFGDDVDEKALFGSDEEAPDIDEKQLFGSDEEQAPGPPPSIVDAKETTLAVSEPSELDEREIFGDVSDDEPEKVEDIVLRRRPAPTDDREIMSLRLPNVLSVERSAFRPDRIPEKLLEGYKEFKNTRDTNVVKLLNAENCVRWRFKKGADGQILTDEDGRPQYESNSRIVEWEDGSRTLYVGSEAFNMSEISDNVVLFEENSQDVHVCHGVVRKRLVATPTSLRSSTHESLKRSQYRKYEPVRRSLLLSQEDQVEAKQLYEMEMEQKKRQEARPKRAVEAGAAKMSAAFLEDQPEAGAGPSIQDIKKAYKSKGDGSKRLRP